MLVKGFLKDLRYNYLPHRVSLLTMKWQKRRTIQRLIYCSCRNMGAMSWRMPTVGTLVNICNMMSVHGVRQFSYGDSLEVNCPHTSDSTTSVMKGQVVMQGRKAFSVKTQA